MGDLAPCGVVHSVEYLWYTLSRRSDSEDGSQSFTSCKTQDSHTSRSQKRSDTHLSASQSKFMHICLAAVAEKPPRPPLMPCSRGKFDYLNGTPSPSVSLLQTSAITHTALDIRAKTPIMEISFDTVFIVAIIPQTVIAM